jgi:hypothetical protein
VFEAKPGTSYDRFGQVRSGDELLALAKQVVREMMPWDADWLEHATLSDPDSWLVGAITPTVRDPVRDARSARPILPLGDAYHGVRPARRAGREHGQPPRADAGRRARRAR